MNNMYKKILISLALVAGLSSCNGDYTDWVQPEENTQQEVKEVAMQFTAVTDLIDLDKVEGNTVKIGDFTTANVQKITDAVYTVKAGDRSYGIPVAEDGTVAVDNLKGAVVELYGRDVEERTLEGNISAKGWTDTTDVQSQNLVVLLKTTEPVVIKVEMYKKGYIYKGLKPVYWCPKDETALAEAEIEYKDDPCTTVYVKFQVNDDLGKLSKYGDISKMYFVIWTTTIWTLPGNLAIAVHPRDSYVLVKADNGEHADPPEQRDRTEHQDLAGTPVGSHLCCRINLPERKHYSTPT